LRPGDEVTIGNHRYQVTWDHAPAHAPRRAAPSPVSVDDDMLEECDEPVPLPEPAGPANARPPASARADEPSVVIPENLELLPNSGSLPGPAAPK
jgi:hypothetical protein